MSCVLNKRKQPEIWHSYSFSSTISKWKTAISSDIVVSLLMKMAEHTVCVCSLWKYLNCNVS